MSNLMLMKMNFTGLIIGESTLGGEMRWNIESATVIIVEKKRNLL